MIRTIIGFALTTLVLAFSTATAQEKASQAPQEKMKGVLEVSEAKLGTAVENRQIVGEGETFAVGQKVYLWLELKGGPTDSVTVTWKHGEMSYPTMLKVGGPTYHTWAYKTAAMAGPWTVSVTDAAGNELKQLNFTVGESTGK
ncbi:MAG: DUF2914 domain-containing protein [Bacteroidota bacterium]